MKSRFLSLAVLLSGLVMSRQAPAALVVDIGGPGVGDSVFIQAGGQLTVDVWISSTTGTDTLVEFLPIFDLSSTRSDLNSLNNFLEFAESSLQPTGFTSDPDYVFFGDSEGLVQGSFGTGNYPTRPGALVGLEMLDASQRFVSNLTPSGTVITRPFLLGQFVLVHDLNGLDPSQVEGEQFEISLPPVDDPFFEGPFFDVSGPIAFSANRLAVTVTAVPEPSAVALCGLMAIGVGGFVAARRPRARSAAKA